MAMYHGHHHHCPPTPTTKPHTASTAAHFIYPGKEKSRLLTKSYSRYEKEFDAVQDVFELQRNLNNAFAYDLVPSTSVITAALKAARRVNDFPTAVRIFEGTNLRL